MPHVPIKKQQGLKQNKKSLRCPQDRGITTTTMMKTEADMHHSYVAIPLKDHEDENLGKKNRRKVLDHRDLFFVFLGITLGGIIMLFTGCMMEESKSPPSRLSFDWDHNPTLLPMHPRNQPSPPYFLEHDGQSVFPPPPPQRPFGPDGRPLPPPPPFGTTPSSTEKVNNLREPKPAGFFHHRIWPFDSSDSDSSDYSSDSASSDSDSSDSASSDSASSDSASSDSGSSDSDSSDSASSDSADSSSSDVNASPPSFSNGRVKSGTSPFHRIWPFDSSSDSSDSVDLSDSSSDSYPEPASSKMNVQALSDSSDLLGSTDSSYSTSGDTFVKAAGRFFHRIWPFGSSSDSSSDSSDSGSTSSDETSSTSESSSSSSSNDETPFASAPLLDNQQVYSLRKRIEALNFMNDVGDNQNEVMTGWKVVVAEELVAGTDDAESAMLLEESPWMEEERGMEETP